MEQRTYRVKTREEAYEQIAQVFLEQGWKEEETLLHIVESGFYKEEMQEFLDTLTKRYPRLKKAGITVGGLIDNVEEAKEIRFTFAGAVDGEHNGRLTGIRLSFLHAKEATFAVKQLPVKAGEGDKAIACIRKWMEEMPYLRAVELFPCFWDCDISRIVEEISQNREEVCFFGAMASLRVDKKIFESTQVERMMFSMGDEILQNGITLVFYMGSKLCVHAEMIFGWRPIGRPHRATVAPNHVLGDCCVTTIDNLSPENFYKKYIGVELNKWFVENVCEFPLVVERNGVYLGRIPSMIDEHGTLYFYGDVKEGENVQLSYGNKRELLAYTLEASNRMREYGAEALIIPACGNRINFLEEMAFKEFHFFEEQNPQLLAYHGGAEIFRWNREGGILNSTMVVVGFKECLSEEEVRRIAVPKRYPECEKKRNGVIPLDERLSTLLQTITGELVDAVIAANDANKAKSAFLSNMSHEIRTPINAVLGMDEMILRETEEETIRQYAKDIRMAGNSLLGIVNDILDFSKIEAGKMEVVPVEYELASVLNDLINLVQKRITDKGLKLIVECDNQIPHLLIGDEIRIKQVITNILTNAVKYTEEGSITLRIGMEKKDDNHILLKVAVKDTGIGMKKEEMGKLFTAFERLDMKRNRTVEGTGLGMSITTGLLQLMGSKLQVESVYRQGSEFSFAILQQVIKWEPIGNFEEAMRRSMEGHVAYQESFRAPGASILVVDDTPMNLTVVRGLLKQTEVQIDTAPGGPECLKLCREKKYDIIFLDHRMPKMDGIETLRRLLEDTETCNKETPVIALTANAISGARAMYFAAGFQDYLSKPIDSAKLEAMIVKFLPKEKVQLVEKAPEDENLKKELLELPEALGSIEALRLPEGLKNCGDAKGYLKALKIFAQSVESSVKEISTLYETNNWRDYTTKVHALKSSARIIGARQLSELAFLLETAGNNQDLDVIRENTDALLMQYQRIGKKISQALIKETQRVLPEIDKESLMEAYSGIQEFAEGYDYDSIQFIMQSLSSYEIPGEEKERFNKVKMAVQQADWETLRQIIP